MNAVTFPRTVCDTRLQFVAVCSTVSYISCCTFIQVQDIVFKKMSEEVVLGKRGKTLQRRSSLETIMYICNQGYQVFPHVFLRVHDFRTSLGADLRKIIPFIKAMLVLRLGVYLSLCCLFLEAFCCFLFLLRLPMLCTSFFLLGCICLLCLLAFQIFDVISILRKKLLGYFFVKKKSQ